MLLRKRYWSLWQAVQAVAEEHYLQLVGQRAQSISKV